MPRGKRRVTPLLKNACLGYVPVSIGFSYKPVTSVMGFRLATHILVPGLISAESVPGRVSFPPPADGELRSDADMSD